MWIGDIFITKNVIISVGTNNYCLLKAGINATVSGTGQGLHLHPLRTTLDHFHIFTQDAHLSLTDDR